MNKKSQDDVDKRVAEIENEGKIKTGVKAIDDLSGDDAKVCGCIPFTTVIYVTSTCLMSLMFYAYKYLPKDD